jgi:uncharacterized damage-inducible protein DinB
MPEAWLRGPIDGVPAELMPAAHSLIDALEDLERATADLNSRQLWLRPGGVASVGFHLRHVCGSSERLLSYARGEALTRDQLDAIRSESESSSPPASASELLDALRACISHVLDAYRGVQPEQLHEPRRVGRAGLPSTLHGLLFHIAEHTRRHAGQAIATAGIIRGLELDQEPSASSASPSRRATGRQS